MSFHQSYRPRVLVVLLLLFLAGIPLHGGTHTVKRGDTLYSLARVYKTSVAQFKAVNGLSDADVKRLRAGQRLKIPGTTGISTASRSGSSISKSPAAANSSSSRSGSSLSSSLSSRSGSGSRAGGGKRVVIDAGHGGKDWGAHHGGVREAYLNLRVAQKLESELEKRGYGVTMTRRSDTFISLSRRAAIANSHRNAIFVCVHFNCTSASWVRGVETFYAGPAGRSLGVAIQREIVRRCHVKNRGVRSARFAVLVQTRCPAVLVEGGFLSNPSERARCATNSYQNMLAAAIADGIGNYKW